MCARTNVRCTASSYSMMNNPMLNVGSLFIRAMDQSVDSTYWISHTAGNLTGIGHGLVLEIRPVPAGQTRYFNCLWLEKVSQCEDPYMMYTRIHNSKKPGTEPFYIVAHKPNKSLEKELVRTIETIANNDDVRIPCQQAGVSSLLGRFLDRVRS